VEDASCRKWFPPSATLGNGNQHIPTALSEH
jgi:hypothetical protein